FEAYLECPGFSYYGNHLAGIPFGLIGHNRFMSVGLTMFKNDDSDFYAETVNPKNSNQYSKKGVWTDFEIRKEVIKVKNAPDVNFDVRITNHGPIMNDVLPDLKQKQNAPLAVWWEHTQAPSRMFDAFYQISHSKSLAEVEQAASWIYSPGLNLLYADSTGNIAWWACARLPIRPKGPNPSLVLDGASGKDDILGYYSFDQNPSSVNPPEGILYSANNQADSTAKPIVEGYYADDYRARRIHELLLRKDKLTVADMLEIQMDDNGTQLKQTLADLVAVLNTKSLNDTEKKVLELAKTWDGTHSLMQQGPTIYTKWVYLVWQAAMADELGDKAAENLFNLYTGQRSLRYIFRLPNSPWWDNATTPARESLSDLVTQSFHETCKALAQQLGTDPTTWVWKRVHTVTYGHILGKKKPLDKLFDVGPFEATGGNEVVNKLDFVVTNSGEYPAKGGPAMRIICDFADITHSRSVLPTGQSGHFMSPYYADQATMYLAGKNRPQLMNRDDVEKGKHSILTLLPKK
ncbi:MAG: hypothetical protein RIS47_1730, partial [Bacteroidota bacterium]